MRRRLLLGVLATGYGRAVGIAVQLVLVPALTLSWGLPLYGQWLMLATVPVFLAASDFGFSTAAGVRLIAEVARGELDEALVTYRSARRMVLMLGSAVLAASFLAVPLLADGLLEAPGVMDGRTGAATLLVLVVYAVLTLQGPLVLSVLRATGRTPRAIALDSSMQLAEGLAVLATVLLGGGPLHAAIAYAVVRLVGVLSFLALARRAAPWLAGQGRASRERVRQLWRPAAAAMALPISQAVYLQGSALAVGAAAGAAAVPIYTTLRTLSRLGLQLVTAVAHPLMPEYTAAHARGDTRTMATIAGLLAAGCLAVAVVSALVIGLFGDDLLALWTRGVIQPPAAMIALTAVGLAMSIVWAPLSDLLLAINRHESFAYVYSLCALGSVGLTLLLVAHIGVTGAAAANLCLEAVMLATVTRSLKRNGAPIRFPPGALAEAFRSRKAVGSSPK